MKLGAFFRILFGTLGAILLLGVAVFLILRFRGSWAGFSYPLDSRAEASSRTRTRAAVA